MEECFGIFGIWTHGEKTCRKSYNENGLYIRSLVKYLELESDQEKLHIRPLRCILV